jgi:cytoskeletal protein CcmA (bactofilin family)
MGLVATGMILAFATISVPAFGVAGDVRSSSEIVIGEDETIADDVYLAGGTVEFLGVADGDVSVAAGQTTLDGMIAGSVQLASGQTEISGVIEGSLRILSGRVEISGTVEGDVVMAGGQLELASGGQIGGNLIVAGGDIDLRGDVGGDVTGYSLNTTFGGAIGGSSDINTSGLEITDTARITGPVSYTSRRGADVSAGAQLAQGIERQELNPWGGGGEDPISRASGSLLRIMWALVVGALIVIAAPRLADQLGSNGKRLARSLLFGLATLVAAPIVAIVLMVTIIGIPGGIIVIAMFLLALYLSQVFAGLAIGQFILPNRWNDGSRGFHLLAMTLGVILIGGLRFIPVPYVHLALTLVVTIWGIGAASTLIGSLNRQERVGAG